MALKLRGFDKLVKQLQNYKEGMLVVLIGLVTLAVESLVEIVFFRCPCGYKSERIPYALLFMLVPCVILFTIGVGFNPSFWKLCTGTRKGCSPKSKFDGCCSRACCNYFLFALVAPMIWLVLVFIDGDYFSCADASTVYERKANESCIPGESPFTSTYNESKERSQIIGMSFAGVISLVVFAVYLSVKACSPMTYYQEKINSKCKKKMMEILVAEFENAIDKPLVPAARSEEQKRENANNQAQGVVKKYKEKKLEANEFWYYLHHNLERGNYDLTQTNLDIIASKKLNASTTASQSTYERLQTESV